MSDNDFVWNDELVKEMIYTTYPLPEHFKDNIQKSLDKFKEERTNQNWQILYCSNPFNNEKHEYSSACVKDACRINSVKRLSDGVVFRLGDQIDMGDEYTHHIKSFWLNHKGNGLWISTNDINQYGITFDEAKKGKYKLFLFTTADGVEVFDDYKGTIYAVGSDWVILPCNVKNYYKIDPIKYFSTENRAEEYVIINKEVLVSAKEITDWFSKKDGSEMLKQFYHFFESKITF